MTGSTTFATWAKAQALLSGWTSRSCSRMATLCPTELRTCQSTLCQPRIDRKESQVEILRAGRATLKRITIQYSLSSLMGPRMIKYSPSRRMRRSQLAGCRRAVSSSTIISSVECSVRSSTSTGIGFSGTATGQRILPMARGSSLTSCLRCTMGWSSRPGRRSSAQVSSNQAACRPSSNDEAQGCRSRSSTISLTELAA